VDLSPDCVGYLTASPKQWRPNDTRLLFATKSGTPWDQGVLLRRKFRPLLKELEFLCLSAMGSTPSDTQWKPLWTVLVFPYVRQDRLGHLDS
jgi:hypothetical protein